MRYQPIDNKLFQENRERFIANMKPNSMAVFVANHPMPRSADSFYGTYRPNPDLYYLTGIEQEETALILYPDHPEENMRCVLFILKPNEHLVTWEGHKLSIKQARELAGCERVLWKSGFDRVIGDFMHLADTCYLNLNEHGRMSAHIIDSEADFAKKMVAKYPLHTFKRSAPIMHELRAIKSDLEISVMQTACDITEKAFRRILKFVKPGVYEYEIEAEILHEYLINRAIGPAYPSIVASGADSCILHYVDNNKQCKDGEVLLMDFGANYAHYAADLSRTIPINGRYTARQKAVYNSVLRIMKAATAMLVPGNTFKEYNKEVGKLVENELIQLGVLDATEVKNQNPKQPLYKKYFMHGTSHYLGIDVHDVGSRYRKMEAGMVFTCEPGIYLKEENIGIRIENDILITANKPFDLMANIPIEAEEIEEIMNSNN